MGRSRSLLTLSSLEAHIASASAPRQLTLASLSLRFVNMTEALFGICGKDFVIMAADCHSAFSICRLKDDTDKIHHVEKMMFAASGPSADTMNFVEFISKNLRLQALRTGLELSVKGAVNFTRNELAHALRSGPYQADLLIGGVDADGPHLYFMDYLASAEKVNKAAQGYGAYFAL